ncbi:alpha/beta hydrolase family protein [Pedobacter alpinus]|uniref:Alpha/beta hydrolase family protein n=1 Tax=Pedobacter alpinus TaxID=1590643 RepID=A0ABW5TT85_9SPHI
MGCNYNPPVDPVAVETFFKNPEQSMYRLSPNGKYLSFLKPYKGYLNVYVKCVNDSLVTQVTAYTDRSVRTANWVGNDKLIYLKEKDSLDNYPAFLVNKDGTQNIAIQTSPNTKVNIVDQELRNQEHILIALNERDETFFDVYKLNINTGKKELLVKNPGNIVLWFTDNDGEVNLAIGSDGVNETLYFRNNESEKFKPVISNNFKSTLKPLGFTKDKNHIYALSNLSRDKLALVEFDCATGKEIKVIYENKDADILEVVNSKTKGNLAYLTYEIDKREIHFLDANYQSIYNDIHKILPNDEVIIVDKDASEHHFIVKTYTDKSPGVYYLYAVKDKSLTKLADVNSAINPDNMCAMKAVSYKARDGQIIHGYLTLPIGKDEKNLPCIVMPHQGPSARNVWGYTPEVQYLANKGYAVFQMNYRGSTGYGKNFQNAGFKQWGKKVQEDIYDGVKWLINQDLINPKKIGVFGYGFGGYSALNQVVYYPQLYKCAASYSGYINLFTYLKGFPAYYKPYKLMLNEMIGDPEKDIDYLKSSSPIFQVDKIKTPILIAQGGKDSKVNVTETNQFVKELRKKQIAVNYILNENETQLFKNPENKFTFYRQLGDFLDKQINPDK